PPLQLRELIITGGFELQRFPTSIGRLKHLKIIIAVSLEVNCLPKEFCALESLEHLELRCSSLPTSFGDLTSLRHIDFCYCWFLEMLPVSFKQLIHLQHLDLTCCKNLTFRSDMMENMTKLELLRFSGCSKLEELPHHITNQVSLRELHADDTGLKYIPTNIGALAKLQVLEIGSPFLEILPSSLENMSSLSRLRINGCNMLKSLPNSVGRLIMLKELWIERSGVESFPEEFEHLTHVQHLGIIECPLTQLGSTTSLCRFKVIDIRDTKVSSISISEDSCPTLETLSLFNNTCLTDIETLPTSVKTIKLSVCKMLKSLRGIRGLINLQILSIFDCPHLYVLPSLRGLASLKEIVVRYCHNLIKIESVEALRSVKTIILDSCPRLKELPSFATLSSIQEIKIERCYILDKIQGLEHSRSLETLAAKTLGKSGGIQSLEQAERLKSVTVVAESRSALQPCIQTFKKWPSEMVIIGGRAVSGVESVMDSFIFPDLTVVRSLKRRTRCGLECLKSHSSDAAIVCFMVAKSFQCSLNNTHVSGQDACFFHTVTNSIEGEWVFVGVFRQGCRLMDKVTVAVEANTIDGEVKRGMLVVGDEVRILQAFTHYWDLFF
ncbi:hypothetical protein KI387_035613, partial [Taxus chinensis]